MNKVPKFFLWQKNEDMQGNKIHSYNRVLYLHNETNTTIKKKDKKLTNGKSLLIGSINCRGRRKQPNNENTTFDHISLCIPNSYKTQIEKESTDEKTVNVA